MATLGDLSVRIRGNTGDLDKSLRKSGAKVEQFGSQMKRTATDVRVKWLAITAAVAAAGIPSEARADVCTKGALLLATSQHPRLRLVSYSEPESFREVNMDRLSLDDIIHAPDLETKEIDIPEWSGSVKITTFSLARRDAMLKKAMVNGQMQNDLILTMLLAAGMLEPSITEAEAERLKEKSFRVIERIATEIMKLNGMLPEEVKRIEQAFPADAGPAGSA